MAVLLVCGCARWAEPPGDAAVEGRYRVGQPYHIDGVWYVPREDFDYAAVGEASWYGPGFHGEQTANGEIYDQNDLTAAHPTLQLPAVVRVTNLRNGRSVVLRVNDRGPFEDRRLIDVSHRAATELGFLQTGTAPVRVEVIKSASVAVAEAYGRLDADWAVKRLLRASYRFAPPLPGRKPPVPVAAGPLPPRRPDIGRPRAVPIPASAPIAALAAPAAAVAATPAGAEAAAPPTGPAPWPASAPPPPPRPNRPPPAAAALLPPGPPPVRRHVFRRPAARAGAGEGRAAPRGC